MQATANIKSPGTEAKTKTAKATKQREIVSQSIFMRQYYYN